MAKQVINTGTAANSKNGDPLRTAFTKINANFTEVYASLGSGSILPGQTGNSGKYLTTNGNIVNWGYVPYSSIVGTPTFATVASSGSYSDLSNKPTFSTVAISGSYTDLSNTPTLNTLLPTQSGNTGKVLTTNGSTVSWESTAAITGFLTFNSNILSSSNLANDGNGIVINPGAQPTIIGPGTWDGSRYRGINCSYSGTESRINSTATNKFTISTTATVLELGARDTATIRLTDSGGGGGQIKLLRELVQAAIPTTIASDTTFDGWDESSHANIFSVTPAGSTRDIAIGDPVDGKVWTFINSSVTYSLNLVGGVLLSGSTIYTLLPNCVVTVTKNPSSNTWVIVSESGNFISKTQLKTVVAASTSFADFQARIAAL